MEFQNKLIKRKEYFGLVWIAAHRPNKLSKVDIIHMDLSKKCKDLSEYIVNGRNKNSTKPKLSLLISSHLMKGLVTILLKKSTYLYDELVGLKVQISRSYCLSMPSKTLQAKASKKAKPSEEIITIDQNLPNILDITSIDSMVFAMDKSDANQRNITLADTDDFLNASTMIPIEHDYTMDSFGGLNPEDSRFLFEDATMARMEMAGKDVESMIDQFIPPGVTSTVQKPLIPPSPRAPFGDLSNMQELARYQEPTMIGENVATALAFDQTNIAGDLPVNEPPMPNLFEPTMMSFAQQSDLPQDMHQTEQHIEIPPEIEATSGMVRTVSADIKALKDAKKLKLQSILNRKRKTDQLIVDNITELTVTEPEKMRRLNKQFRPGTQQYINQVNERRAFFRENNPWLISKNDFYAVDLFKQPSGLLAKRTAYPLNQYQQSFAISVKCVEKMKTLRTGAQLDDKHYYLTEALDTTITTESINKPMSELMVGMSNSSVAEKARKNISEQGLPTALKADELRRSKRQSSIMSQQNQRLSSINGLKTIERQEPAHMEQPQLEPISMQPYESILEDIPLINQTTNLQNETHLEELDEFEALIMKNVGMEGTQCVLQDLIKESALPDRCKTAQKPRRMFAAKMFWTALNLAGKKEISLEQNKSYGPITVKGAL